MDVTLESRRLVVETDEALAAEGQVWTRRLLYGGLLFVAVIIPVVMFSEWSRSREEGATVLEIALALLPAVAILISAPFALRRSFKALEMGQIIRLEIDLRRAIVLVRKRTIDESVETYQMLRELVSVDLVEIKSENSVDYGVVFVFENMNHAAMSGLLPEKAVEIWDAAHRLVADSYPDVRWLDHRSNSTRRKIPTASLSMLARYQPVPSRPVRRRAAAQGALRGPHRFLPPSAPTNDGDRGP